MVRDPSGSSLLKEKLLRLTNKLITGWIIDFTIKVFVWNIIRVNEMIERFSLAKPVLCFFPAPLLGFRSGDTDPKREQAAACHRNRLAVV